MGQGGSTRAVEGWLEANRFETVDLIEPAAYLAAAAVLLGLVATLRISPLGALVAGLLLAGVYLGMFADPFAVRDAVPDDWKLFGDVIPLRLPLTNGTLLLIGVLLLMAVFSAQRWRAWPAGPAAAAAPAGIPGEAPTDETPPGQAPPGESPPTTPDGPPEPGAQPAHRATVPAAEGAAPPAAWPAATPNPPGAMPPGQRSTPADGGADLPGQPTSPWISPPRPPGTSAGQE
jgi:hypothetical protein